MVKADNYLLEKSNFDFVQVRNNHGYCGILLPIFKEQRNVEKFEFSIDLGTSNTHIEFRKGNEKPEVFTFTKKDHQLCEMFIPTKNEFGSIEDLIEETELIEKDFIPAEIGQSDFHFPTRTVLSCAKTVDWTNDVDPFTLVNYHSPMINVVNCLIITLSYNIKWGREMICALWNRMCAALCSLLGTRCFLITETCRTQKSHGSIPSVWHQNVLAV